MNTHPHICTHEIVCVPCLGVEWIVDAELSKPDLSDPTQPPGVRPYSILHAVKCCGRWFYAEEVFTSWLIEQIESALDAMAFNDDRAIA